jgi:hypothetical protein
MTSFALRFTSAQLRPGAARFSSLGGLSPVPLSHR